MCAFGTKFFPGSEARTSPGIVKLSRDTPICLRVADYHSVKVGVAKTGLSSLSQPNHFPQNDPDLPQLDSTVTRDAGRPLRREAHRARIRLTENCRLPCGKAHVTRQHELSAGGAYATFDLSNGDQAACAQMPK